MNILSHIRLAATICFVSSTLATAVEPIPVAGTHWLTILTPQVLELGVVLSVSEGNRDTEQWNFTSKIPEPDAFRIFINGTEQESAVQKVGFRRRPRYAPLDKWDLRIEAALIVELRTPVEADASIEVRLAKKLMPVDGASFQTSTLASRRSPVIHASQVGYQQGAPKFARAGYYLGSLGELDLEGYSEFYLRDTSTRKIVFRAPLLPTKDKGFNYAKAPSEQVLLLDFSAFDQLGSYTAGINGIGESYPFKISDNYHACLARTYALGLYHQRCGCKIGLPFSRFQHEACHIHPAKVPEPGDQKTWRLIKTIYAHNHENQTAPPLDSSSDALYPFRRKGEIDVSGGHHDAGDYSKYVVNSAQLIHTLTHAVDAFAGVDRIDNLGIPESGNGIADALDIAAYEAAFLAKMQDSDGGFYFLVYPRERSYETDVTPDNGDHQAVFPKTTVSTAAAAAALCQIASSPIFQKHFPVQSARYLRQARIGWLFLMRAQREHGEIGAYQTISHYGNRFMDRDEIAWLATELYLATGDKQYHDYLLRHFTPGSPDTVHWGWLRLQEGYGAAVRSYATAERTGRRRLSDLHTGHLRACRTAIDEWANQLAGYTAASAYGVAYPFESKRHRVAGWHFAAADTFDLVATCYEHGRIDASYLSAIASNLAYETGANAVDVCHLTGLGTRRQYEIVHQWGLNDREQLPLSGIPNGSLQAGFQYNHRYKKLQGELVYPSDGDRNAPYPLYHRWSDAYNLSTEFTIIQQGKSLAAALALMAQSTVEHHEWQPPSATIEESTSGYSLTLPENLDLHIDDAIVVWEAENRLSPHTGSILPSNGQSPAWISVEAQWSDGRRVFATLENP